MPLTKEDRIELLKKAREAKKIKRESGIITEKKPKKKTLQLDLSNEINVNKDKEETEELIKNEVIKIKAPKKKRIIKRVIEVEEPSTDEEVQEEVIIKERKTKVIEERLSLNEEKPEKVKTERNVSYFRDIFPS